VHASAEPSATLDAGWDVVAVGDGEGTVVGLVRALAGGGRMPDGSLLAVPGLVFREGFSPDTSLPLVRTGRAERACLDTYRAFPVDPPRFNPIEITRGCVYACRFCQTPYLFSARFRHRSVGNVSWHVRRMRACGKRDVRFITTSALLFGSAGTEPDLETVAELLARCRESIGPDGRVFFGSFPSEIRPEHVSVTVRTVAGRTPGRNGPCRIRGGTTRRWSRRRRPQRGGPWSGGGAKRARPFPASVR
jgi:radical SAM superfamily enzyme YgiQ (UPF0313 family)